MVDLSVCIEMVYDESPFHERVHRAAGVGVEAIEFWDWRRRDLDSLVAATEETGVDIVGCTAGGVLTDPESLEETVDTVRESIEMAEQIGIPTLIATSGPDQERFERETQRETIVEVLSQVVLDAEAAGVTIVLEPLNTAVDHPKSYLSTTEEGFDVLDAVDSSAVMLLYDVYHQQITEGNVTQTIVSNIDRIGHIHVADVPGRHEPGTGELNYRNIFAAIDETGYDGYVGCEFSPTVDPDESMAETLRMTR